MPGTSGRGAGLGSKARPGGARATSQVSPGAAGIGEVLSVTEIRYYAVLVSSRNPRKPTRQDGDPAPVPTTPDLPTLARADALELARLLKAFLLEENRRARDVSAAIGRAPEYLTRVFNGRLALKLKDMFAVFAEVGKNPRRFLLKHYPLGGIDVTRHLHAEQLQALPGSALLVRMIEEHLFAAPPPLPELVELRALGALRSAIARAGTKQRHISRDLGLPPDALGQILRERADLMMWHTFGVLRATKTSAASFFQEITAPEDATSLGADDWARLVRLVESAPPPALPPSQPPKPRKR